MVRFVDFPNSYLTFSVDDEKNIARIQLDAICTVFDVKSGEERAYHLIAPCRSESMYRPRGEPLFQMPNFDFRGIWTDHDYRIIRTGWTTDRDGPESGQSADRFAWTRLDVRTSGGSRVLDAETDIVEATLANLPLVVVTEIHHEAGGWRAVLEYPVKTMNVARNPDRFQVDTGPLIVPDFDAGVVSSIDQLALAHVVYWHRDTAEFILRRPTPVSDGSDIHVTDYSEIHEVEAVTRILTVDGL